MWIYIIFLMFVALIVKIYRIEEQVLRFVSTGEWSLILTPGTIEKIQVYKQNYKLQNEHSLIEFKNIIQYLKEVKNYE